MSLNHASNHAVLIDDDIITLELAARQVRGSDLELVCLPSSDEGIEYLQKNRPDVVLIDFRMPRMYGVELLEHMREDPRIAATRFIIWSGSELSDRERERCELAGARVVDKEIVSDRASFLELLGQH